MKHYAITGKGRKELKSAMMQLAKMTEMIDTYRETHEALFKFRKACTLNEITKMLTDLGNAFGEKNFEFSKIFPSEEKRQAEPTQPVMLKVLYVKENRKLRSIWNSNGCFKKVRTPTKFADNLNPDLSTV